MSHSTLLRQRHCLPSARFGLARAAALVRLCRLRRPLRSILVVLANSSFGAFLSLSFSLFPSFSLYLSPSLVLSGAPFRAATLLLPLIPRISSSSFSSPFLTLQPDALFRKRARSTSLFFSTLLLLLSDSRLPSSSIKRTLRPIVSLGPCAPLPRSLSRSVGFSLSLRPRRFTATSRSLFHRLSRSLSNPTLAPRHASFSRRPPRFPAVSLRSSSARSLFPLLESARARARAHTRAVAYRRSACLPELFRHR